jgi:hypothetical protein
VAEGYPVAGYKLAGASLSEYSGKGFSCGRSFSDGISFERF